MKYLKSRIIDYLIDVPNKILTLLCVLNLLWYVFSFVGEESVNLRSSGGEWVFVH